MKNFASKIIVDDVLLYGRTDRQLLDYLRTVLDVLKHQRDILKLKKCKWFQDKCEFVGMDVAEDGTQPAQSKNEAFAEIERPNTWGDLRMLIVIFGLYSQFLPLYNLDIRPWRYIFVKLASTRDTISKGGDGNNAEPMEYRGPKVTGNFKEGHFIRTYFSNIRLS